MSEMEELKKNADESLRLQRHKELHAYLEELSKVIDERFAVAKKSWLWYGAGWLVWITSGLTQNELIEGLGLITFFAGWLYMTHCGKEFATACAEFKGAVKVLEILGLVPPHDCDGHKKRKKEKSPFAETVKSWFTQKKAAQDKVWAPA